MACFSKWGNSNLAGCRYKRAFYRESGMGYSRGKNKEAGEDSWLVGGGTIGRKLN
jgi:hypothetical protein